MIISGTSLVAGCTTHAWLLLNVTGYVKNLHADVVDHCLRAVRIRSFSMTAVFLARGHIYSVPVLVLPHFRDGCKFWGRGTSVGLLVMIKEVQTAERNTLLFEQGQIHKIEACTSVI